MNIIKQIIRRKREKELSYTVTDNIFIPMFCVDAKQCEKLMAGHICLSPVADEKTVDELLTNVPSIYKEEFNGKFPNP